MGPGGGKPGSIQSVGKDKVNIIGQDGYEVVKQPRKVGHPRRRSSRWKRKGQETVLPGRCKNKYYAEKLVRRNCVTDGVAKKQFGVAPELLQNARKLGAWRERSRNVKKKSTKSECCRGVRE